MRLGRITRRRASALLLAAATVGRPRRASAQGSQPLRIGTTLNDSYFEPFYALDGGFFARAGLDVAVQPFSKGSGVTAALAAGAIDIGITNPISLANAVEHGLPFAFFASAALYNRDEVEFCVAADAPIASARDLDGKVVGTTALRDSNSLHIVAWIDSHGGDSTQVHLVEVPFPAMAPAILRGTIAGAPIAEPYLSAALRAGGLRVFAHTMDVFGPVFMVGGWCAQRAWIEEHRPLVRRLVAAIYETAR